MTDRIQVFIYSDDPILQAGVATQLRGRPRLETRHDDLDQADVAVVAGDVIDEELLRIVRAVQRDGCPRVVVCATRLDEAGLMDAIGAGAVGFIRRREGTPERLESVVEAAAAGDGSVPPDLLGRLLGHISKLAAAGPGACATAGFSERELDVLRMVADGLETSEIAQQLCYSERTVKGVVHDVTSRLGLRNRAQAVAYAVRQGLI